MASAGNRYQSTHKGKLKHALRQARYRARHKIVTHQGSPSRVNDDLLSPAKIKPEEEKPEQVTDTHHCHFCFKEVSAFYRKDFRSRRTRA